MNYAGLISHLRTLHFENKNKTYLDPTVADEVLERIREGFFVLGPDGRIKDINLACAEYMNMSKDDVLGKQLEDVMASSAATIFKENFKKVLKKECQTSFEVSCENKIFSIKAYPNRRGGVAFFLKNDTEIKVAEKLCDSALASKFEFISTASHELKTPLTALILQIEMAKKQLEQGQGKVSEQKMKTILKRAYDDSLRISRLVKEMQDVSRAGNGDLKMKFDFFHLGDFIEESICSNFPSNHLEIEVSAPVIVHWDKMWMRQVILNLISVILCYNVGSPLSLKVSTGGGYAYIEVTTPGTTINEENFGLAFFLWDEIIRLHKGRFEVLKTKEKSTSFKLQVPLRS